MKLKSNLMLRKIGAQYIVLADRENIDVTKVISLNATAAFLWKEAEGKEFTVPQLVEALCASYDVDSVRATTDIEKTIAIWKENGLIETDLQKEYEE